MTVEEIIKKSIEGGWEKAMIDGNELSHVSVKYEQIEFREYEGSLYPILRMDVKSVMFDPSFWQSLGKAMGWVTTEYMQEVGEIKYPRKSVKVKRQDWLKKWHKFIDHLADGGTIESYFEQL